MYLARNKVQAGKISVLKDVDQKLSRIHIIQIINSLVFPNAATSLVFIPFFYLSVDDSEDGTCIASWTKSASALETKAAVVSKLALHTI